MPLHGLGWCETGNSKRSERETRPSPSSVISFRPVALRRSLQQAPAIDQLLDRSDTRALSYFAPLPDLSDLSRAIEDTLCDEPPLALKDGGLIRPGFHAELDELVELGREGKGALARLESDVELREREKRRLKMLEKAGMAASGAAIPWGPVADTRRGLHSSTMPNAGALPPSLARAAGLRPAGGGVSVSARSFAPPPPRSGGSEPCASQGHGRPPRRPQQRASGPSRIP